MVRDTLDLSDLEPVEIDLEIQGEKYVLKEASEDAARQYQAERSKYIKLQEDGSVKIEPTPEVFDLQSMLVSRCVFKVHPGKNGQPDLKPVSTGIVLGWSGRIVERLYEKIRQISELDKSTSDESVKNEPSDTVNG